jgi:excisionase family DNA binding protein
MATTPKPSQLASQMLTPREAARFLGISYPTIKQWILSGKLKTAQTPGGHHRVAQSALKPFIEKDRKRIDSYKFVMRLHPYECVRAGVNHG